MQNVDEYENVNLRVEAEDFLVEEKGVMGKQCVRIRIKKK